jgi:hypothetical protein
MYFDETDANNWVLKDAFDSYHSSFNGDLVLTIDQFKKDLESFMKRPNILVFSKSRARQLLNDWSVS